MSEPRDELRAIERAADEIVPALAAKLGEHGLGEIEVRRGSLRIRVAAGLPAAAPSGAGSPSSTAQGSPAAAPAAGASPAAAGEGAALRTGRADGPHLQAVTAPAVGYFVYGDGLGPGTEVQEGDPLGTVDVLGVRHDVHAPRAGTVRGLAAETGEAVEYGQVLIELEVAGG
jgi:biotin carboxyl carrier protein